VVIRVNGEERTERFDSVAAMLSELAIETRGVAVAVNGEIVRRGAWADTALIDGDNVEIVSAAAGG
jgi:sulfur carrier protein